MGVCAADSAKLPDKVTVLSMSGLWITPKTCRASSPSMWSKLNTNVLLGNVKDAWSSIEQSLDAAVGQDASSSAGAGVSASTKRTSPSNFFDAFPKVPQHYVIDGKESEESVPSGSGEADDLVVEQKQCQVQSSGKAQNERGQQQTLTQSAVPQYNTKAGSSIEHDQEPFSKLSKRDEALQDTRPQIWPPNDVGSQQHPGPTSATNQRAEERYSPTEPSTSTTSFAAEDGSHRATDTQQSNKLPTVSLEQKQDSNMGAASLTPDGPNASLQGRESQVPARKVSSTLTESASRAALTTNVPAAASSPSIDESEIVHKAGWTKEVCRLTELLRESEARTACLERELRKTAVTHCDADDSKDRQIAGLIEEGKALAFRQSEMERVTRKARGELKEVESERARLRDEKEDLQVKIASLTELIKKKEGENGSLTQNLAAVQAVNSASSKRLADLQAEMSKAKEKLSGQTAALDKARGEEKGLKRIISDMTAEQGDLLSRLDDDQALSKGLQSIKNDFEQRENLLKAHYSQLQEALGRATFEAGLREDNLKQEFADMRKRWQAATSRSETLAANIHESTTPLLRQIKALQEAARVQTSAWAAAEESLNERAWTAEASARAAEAAQGALAERINTLSSRVNELELSLSLTNGKVQQAGQQLAVAKGCTAEVTARANAAEQELRETKATMQRMAKEGEGLEARLKLSLQDTQTRLEQTGQEHKEEKQELLSQIHSLRRELDASRRRSSSQQDLSGRKGHWSSTEFESVMDMPSQSAILGRSMGEPRTASQSDVSRGDANCASTGNTPLLAIEKIQQALRQKESEAIHLRACLVDVERMRDALTCEVAVLGKQQTHLQGVLQSAKGLRVQVADLTRKNDVLLELLGEKTEEWETLKEEVADLKAKYK